MSTPAKRTTVVPLHGTGEAQDALAELQRYLGRCKPAVTTVATYRRQAAAYVDWLGKDGADHTDAFTDLIGAEAAVTAWRRALLRDGASPATVNQALAALTLRYEHGAGLRIQVKHARLPRPGQPEALDPAQQGRLERAADRRGTRDAAIIATLLYTGARAAECTGLHVDDVAVTARTGRIRVHGKGDQDRTIPVPAPARQRLFAWMLQRGHDDGPLWIGQRGPLTTSGLTQVVLATGADAGLPGLRPHRLRHTYATRLRQGGADVAQIQALLGHASLDTAGRYFRAGTGEQAALVETVFQQ